MYDAQKNAGKGGWSFWDSEYQISLTQNPQNNNQPDNSLLSELNPDTLYWIESYSLQPLQDINTDFRGKQTLLHNDHLGSVTLTLNENGALAQHSRYQPYGDAANLQPHKVQPYGFSGKEKDLSGLLYFEARYYDPISARFISPDPLFAEKVNKCIASVLECNLYQYTSNNPISYVDPTGLAGGLAAREERLKNRMSSAEFQAHRAEQDRQTEIVVNGVIVTFEVLDTTHTIIATVSGVGVWTVVAKQGVKKGLKKAVSALKERNKKPDCNCFVAGTSVVTENGSKTLRSVIGCWQRMRLQKSRTGNLLPIFLKIRK